MILQEEEPEMFERHYLSKPEVLKSISVRSSVLLRAQPPLAPAFAFRSPALGPTRLLDGPLD